MEGFQFGEQTQGAATSLNCETGGGERGSGSGHGLRNTPNFHIRHQMLGLTPLGGVKKGFMAGLSQRRGLWEARAAFNAG